MNGKSKADSPSTYETPQCRLRKRDYSRSLASEPDVKVSLHPAQASQRPCEGPVSGDATRWLHDTRRKSASITASATLYPFSLAHGASRWTEGSRRYLDGLQYRGKH